MDPHSFIARAEAQRWLGIAEKLLISHDLVGSKTFAIRARESDPRLESAEQILAIADTLLAADKRVVGNNGAHQPDYYAILQLVRFVQDTDHIASQYRRLALLLQPGQNGFPYADQAFQLVNDAWNVLSNPMRKSLYDSDLDYPPQQQMNTLGFNIEQQQEYPPQQQQPRNFFSINHMEQDLPEQQQQQQQTFQSRLQQSHQQQQQSHQQQHQHQQLQQHNFLSQPNPVRPLPVREQEHMFQHREQEQLFQPQVQPFQVTSPPHQQSRPSPQPQQQQSHIQSPPATPQTSFSWPHTSQPHQKQQQMQHQQHQHHQVKQEQQQLQHVKQEQLQLQMQQEQLKQQQLKQQQLQQEQLKQQQLHQEQLKQQQLQEEQRKQQQLQEEQRKQQQQQEEQRKQQQLQQEQLKQQQLQQEQLQQQRLMEEQRKQQQLLEEQRKQQQFLEEQRKQQLQEEQRKQQQLLAEQLKQQQLLEEQRKQQQLHEEQRKQQQLHEEQRKQQQLQEEQLKQQQLQEEQRKQQQQLQEEQHMQQQLQQERQQQESLKQNVPPIPLPNNGVREEDTEMETEAVDDSHSPNFWTACPYCFYMYEYPKLYMECTLRCDNCKRAFQAVPISSPPPIIEGQDACFYCWGFFPLGLSMSELEKDNNKGKSTNWTPFSSLHNASNSVQNHLNEQAAPKANPFVNKSSGPRIYIDDVTDDVFNGVSEPSSDSDIDWRGIKKHKSKRMGKKGFKDESFKERIQVLALRAMYTGNEGVKNLKQGIRTQERVGVSPVLVVETGKKNRGSNRRKQSGRVARESGKLDLNVEFDNNDGEETAPRMAAGSRTPEQGEEDIVEGVEFFEGLDEYLSSLPILSVPNEEKVTVA